MISQARGEGEGERNICPKVPFVPYFPRFPFKDMETTGKPPSVCVAEEITDQNTDLNQVPLWLLFD